MSNLDNGFSVLMSVYIKDNPEFLRDCLDSIHAQTLLPDEVVIVQDGEITNLLHGVIQEYRKKLNIKSVELEKNAGLAKALNVGLKNCTHELVARMDADDICHPSRFEDQINFMKNNQHVDVLGGFVSEFKNDPKHEVSVRRVPIAHEAIKKFAKRRSPVSHPTVFFKKSSVLNVGGYPDFRKAQDYALWSRMIVSGFVFANIPKILVYMRCGDGLMQRRGISYLRNELRLIVYQHKIGLLSKGELVINIIGRCAVRSLPNGMKSMVYQYMRGK